MINKKSTAITAILVIIFSFHGTAFSNAFDMNAIGVRACAMGSAFTGISDDASAIYFNPGGLTSVENGRWDIDASLLTLFMGFKWVTPDGKEYQSTNPASLPALLAATSFGDFACGAGIYIPFGGGGVKYSDVFGPGSDFKAEIAFIALTASAAYNFFPGFSAGAGISVYYGIINILTVDSTLGIPIETDARFKGISGAGGNLGFMYKINSRLSAGLNIRNKIPMKMEGTAELLEKKYNSRVELTMPWYYVAGIAYRILPELLIDFDLWYMTWSNTDRITITVKDVDLLGGRDAKSVIQTYYKNSIDAMIGAEYLVNKKFTLRAGIKYEEQVPHDERGVNISLNCETDRYTVTIGAGYRINEQIEMNLSFGYLYGVTNRVESGTYYQSHRSVTAGVRILL